VFASGGPSANGSMRAITLKRGGKTVGTLDLYAFIAKGDKSQDMALQPGDVISIPAAGPRVALTGATDHAAIYELSTNTTVQDVLALGGGVPTLASAQKALIERIDPQQPGAPRQVSNLALNAQGLAQGLRDGDVITLLPISPAFANAITLQGTVAQPLRHAWREGMRVQDLIPDREALITPEYYRRKNQLVQNRAASLKAQGLTPIPERAALLSRSYWVGRTRLAPVQRAEAPDQRAEAVERRTADELRPPQGEVNWDYAVIERINPTDYSTSLVPFHLGKAVIEGDPEQNLLLEPGDVVTIFSKSDVRVPVAHQTRYVRLEGEMAQAGVFQVQPGETLRQLVRRVGGLSPNAYLFAAEFNRESTRRMQQEKLDAAADRLEREAQRVAASQAQNAINPNDAASAKAQAEAQMALIARLRGVKAAGRIVLEVPPGGRDLKDLPDIPLEDGDRFYVPAIPSTVSVFGAVYNENAFLHKGGKKMDDYLRQAGGPTKDADEDALYVMRADGSVMSRAQSGAFSGNGRLASLKMMPGDAIVVPEKLDRTEFRRALRDWTQIFSQFGLGVAALRVLKGF